MDLIVLEMGSVRLLISAASTGATGKSPKRRASSGAEEPLRPHFAAAGTTNRGDQMGLPHAKN